MLSKIGKTLFFFSALAFVILGLCRLVYGGWHDSFWFPLVLCLALFAAGVVKDRHALKEIFTMRSTKYGMNMGALIITVMVGLGCVNFLASRYEKRFDWTSDKLNSLSDQSLKAAQALKTDTELILLYGYKGPAEDPSQSPDAIQRQIKVIGDMYRNASSKIKFSAYNALQRPDLTQKYEYNYGPYAFYAVQGERKVKIDPATEESVTRALMRLERDKKKVIYFTRGHGELLLDEKGEKGLSTLKDDLSVTYEIKSFALFETKNVVPDDASMVAIIGPTQQFLDDELKALREYAMRGGHFLIAIDPGTKQNLAGLIKSFGIELTNEYVFDGRSRALKATPRLVLGTNFSKSSEITRAIRQDGNAIALFDLASHLKKAPDAPAGLQVELLVGTDGSTGSVSELKQDMVIKPNGPHNIAMTSKGKLNPSIDQEFSAAVFADSDFIANRLIQNNLNRDLIENSVAWLSSDHDLISIRPKEPKSTQLKMMNSDFKLLMVILFFVSVSLFGSSIGFWWRRRMA